MVDVDITWVGVGVAAFLALAFSVVFPIPPLYTLIMALDAYFAIGRVKTIYFVHNQSSCRVLLRGRSVV